MPLLDDVEHFLKNAPDGQRLYGNAIGGARDGLYGFDGVEAIFKAAAVDALPNETVDAQSNIKTFIESFNALCFIEIPGKRATRLVNYVPMPLPNTPDISTETVYSVTNIVGLRRAMSEDDIRRLAAKSVVLKNPNNPTEETSFLSSLSSLSRDEKSFILPRNEGLGRFLLWFTTRECLDEAETRCSLISDPLTLAESLRSRNGLGHRKGGEWLVMLTIPGKAIQRAGHHRPIFCDGGVGSECWFMSRSSDHSRFNGGPWGQTCELETLESGAGSYDGAKERVAVQPRLEHLGADRIYFEVLGRVDARFGTAGAMSRLTDGIWTRKDV